MPDEPQSQDATGSGETPPETGNPTPPAPPAEPSSGEKPPTPTTGNVDALKHDLFGERRRRKTAEAELAELRKFKERAEEATKSESERLTERANRAEQRADELARQLQSLQVSAAVRAEAAKQGFRDPEDAVLAIGTDAIELDDDGRPVAKSVEKAVQTVAERKKHWLRGEGEQATGSKFGGSGARKSDQLNEEAVRRMFPALGPAFRSSRS